ncbi:unnamed protein product [Gulo gulo]|uniref:Uncharacterized protein n=1 Tax=Gulo gulo TaxID=48420 RepID=A0A9X9LS53_GULGU|nr:unnamed protein product [Gulo gulo]
MYQMDITSYRGMFSTIMARENHSAHVGVRPKKYGSDRAWCPSAACFPVSTATCCLPVSHLRILRATGVKFVFSNFLPHVDSTCRLEGRGNSLSVVVIPVIFFTPLSYIKWQYKNGLY